MLTASCYGAASILLYGIITSRTDVTAVATKASSVARSLKYETRQARLLLEWVTTSEDRAL